MTPAAAPPPAAAVPRLRIVHETNPAKYFPALYRLAAERRLSIAGAHRYSVAKEWLRAGLRDRKPAGARTRDALGDLGFRLRLPFLRGETVLLGFAPWDARMLLYAPLRHRNRVIYHTSWPDWGPDATPRRYGPLTPLLRRVWLRVLCHPNVRIVAVLESTREDLARRFGLPAEVIPHAVPAEFFAAGAAARAAPAPPLRLVHVGELSAKKGVQRLVEIVAALPPGTADLTLIGDGPLRGWCAARAAALPGVRCLGPIADRARLAAEMARHDLLMLLSQREAGWQELFGIVIPEALAAGLGVIATDHLGPRTILGGTGAGGLVAEGDDASVRALLLGLSADPAALAGFKAAQRGAAGRYRIEAVAAAWERLLTAPDRPQDGGDG